MPSEQEEALFWAGKAADAHHNMLDSVQSSAAKWQAAIAAFLGAYATIAFVFGPTTLAGLSVPLWQKAVIMAVLCAAGLFAIPAVWFANRAAQGFPRVAEHVPLMGTVMARGALKEAGKAVGRLKLAIGLAAVAGVLAVLGSMGILVAGVLAPTPAPTATLVTPVKGYCGTLDTRDGVLSLRLSDSSLIAVRGGTLTVVGSCGG